MHLLAAGAAFGLSLLAVRDLHWEDRISYARGITIFLSGLVFFTHLNYSLIEAFKTSRLGIKFSKSHNLKRSDQLEIANKMVSGVQAIFCCITGMTCSAYSCSRNMLYTSHYISEAYGWFGSSYFFYDIWSMYKVHRAQLSDKQEVNGNVVKAAQSLVGRVGTYLRYNFVIVGHHLFIGIFAFLVITHLRGGFGDCFFGFVYLMEASTPFVSMRGILSKLGHKSGKLYVYNGIAMLVMFFLCRVAMFPYVIYMYGKAKQLSLPSAIVSLPRNCLISIAILLLPQLYWFYLMVRGATQILSKPKKSH